MDDQLVTLSKIFTERLFRIPDYQRGYAWTEKQLKDFWNDIQQLESTNNHYTGVLTLENVLETDYKKWPDDVWIIESKSYQPFYIVDGQQRLTTAIIVVQVILELLPDGTKLNYTEKRDIQKKFIFDSKDDGISRSYIFGYEKDNPSYEFLKTKIFQEKSFSSLGEETIYTQNLEFAKNYFTGLIQPLTHDELESLFKKITQQLLFNIFTITKDVDVCVAFETMNNRGKPLSHLELLKNRLIYLSIKFNAEEYEREKLRASINDCWKNIYQNLGRNKENPLDDDNFLSTHYILYFGNDLLNEMHEEEGYQSYRHLFRADYAKDLLERRFIQSNATDDASKKSKIKLSDVYKYVSSLQEAVDIWYKIFNPFNSGYHKDVQIWLDKFNRLESEYIRPLLLAFLMKENNKNITVEFLKAVERHMFIVQLSMRTYTASTQRVFELEDPIKLALDLTTGKINSQKVTKIINEDSVKVLKTSYYMPEVVRVFRDRGFYYWDGIRYFLYEYNLSLQEASKTQRPKIYWPEFHERRYDFHSVEHIYPQQARNSYWRERFNGLTQKQRETIRNSLGNLLPLSKPKNSSLSNKPFPEKVNGEGVNSSIGYRYGCYAENEITLETEWTPNHILIRGLKLLKFLEDRWDIDIGDEKKKLIC